MLTANVFDTAVGKNGSGDSIFKDRRPLDLNYIPEVLLCRDKHIEQLVTYLSPAVNGFKPENIVIYGVKGSGKTVVVKYITNQLLQKINDKLPIKIAYINCKHIKSESGVIKEVCYAINPDAKLAKAGVSTSDYYKVLWKLVNDLGGNVIVVMDEIDKITDDNILYNLSRAGENGYINQDCYISVIGTSNYLRFLDEVDPSAKSSLGALEFVFDTYTASDLDVILRSRAELAFKSDILDESVIPLCAAFAASSEGDARKAIDLLRMAGYYAEEKKSGFITEQHARLAEARWEDNKIKEIVLSLPKQKQLVLYSIYHFLGKLGRREVSTGDIYNEYVKQCNALDIGFTPLTFVRISNFIAEFDDVGLIEAPIISKGRYGRARQIRLSMPAEKVIDPLKACLMF